MSCGAAAVMATLSPLRRGNRAAHLLTDKVTDPAGVLRIRWRMKPLRALSKRLRVNAMTPTAHRGPPTAATRVAPPPVGSILVTLTLPRMEAGTRGVFRIAVALIVPGTIDHRLPKPTRVMVLQHIPLRWKTMGTL